MTTSGMERYRRCAAMGLGGSSNSREAWMLSPRGRTAAAIGALLIAVLVSGCDEDEGPDSAPPSDGPSAPETSSPSEPTTTPTETGPVEPTVAGRSRGGDQRRASRHSSTYYWEVVNYATADRRRVQPQDRSRTHRARVPRRDRVDRAGLPAGWTDRRGNVPSCGLDSQLRSTPSGALDRVDHTEGRIATSVHRRRRPEPDLPALARATCCSALGTRQTAAGRVTSLDVVMSRSARWRAVVLSCRSHLPAPMTTMGRRLMRTGLRRGAEQQTDGSV